MRRAAARRPLVVVPTYEEAGNVDALVDGVARHAPDAELLFVDAASPDGTAARVRARQAERPGRVHLVERARKEGLAAVYLEGFRWALARDYDAVVQMDADLSHDPAALPALLAGLEDWDVAVGSRYVPGGATRGWPLARRALSRFGNLYARTILGVGVRDLTGGYNAWRRGALEALGLERVGAEGYALLAELKWRALRAGCRLGEVPIVFSERRVGRSKLSLAVMREASVRIWRLRFERG